jgi:hypothetical protein
MKASAILAVPRTPNECCVICRTYNNVTTNVREVVTPFDSPFARIR